MIGEPKSGNHLDGLIKLYTCWYNICKGSGYSPEEHCKVILERLRKTKDTQNEKEGKPTISWEPL